ncbi:hypothetical protein BDF22DRAFT_682943 [Syncephalis plumigaleata]|nr:hypothetical protein BDF22DRAFT_682943 [Syncephalis plumigaleata]
MPSSITSIALLARSIIVLLLCYLQLVWASAKFQVGNRTFTYPTQDLMDIYIAPYTFTGYIAEAIFEEGQECVISPKSLGNIYEMMANSTDMSASKPINATIVVKSNTIDDALCDTITATGFAVHKFKVSLGNNSNVTVQNMIYLLEYTDGPYSGGFLSTAYSNNKLTFTHGKAPVEIALLPTQNYKTVLRENTDHAPIIVTINEEPGIWNESLLSPGYKAHLYLLFVFNLFFLLRGLVLMVMMIRAGKWMSKYRTIIFAIAVVASILYLVELHLPITTPAYLWIDVALETLTNLAFHLLLLLWHSIVRGVQKVHHLKLVYYVILLSFTVVAMRFFFQVLFIFIGYHVNDVDLYTVTASMLIAVIGLVLGLYTYYGVIFWYKQRNSIMSQSTKDALTKVTKICMVCFAGYLFAFTATILDLCRIDYYSISGEILRFVFTHLGYSIRLVVLLFVIELGPGGNSNQNGSSKARSSNNRKQTAMSPKSSHSCFSDSGAIVVGQGSTPLASPSRTNLERPYNVSFNNSTTSARQI